MIYERRSERKRVSQITYMRFYEYSTIEALRKANEQSPMDIVFLEDTIDNCGLTAAKYIRETGQKTSLSTFSERLRIGLFMDMNIRQHII